MTRYHFPTDPIADAAAVVQGDCFRITVLTEGLVRLEYAPDGCFEDRASTFAIRRRLPVPAFQLQDDPGQLIITTARFRLVYDKRPFSSAGLSIDVLGGVANHGATWRYGTAVPENMGGNPNLGGTTRTLDMIDGRVDMGDGIASRVGYAELDDSASMLFTADGWVAARDGSRQDLYVFAYGHDHAQALQAFYAVSGSTPLLPRWALGNWWSRYHRYTADEYLALMQRFRDERIPMSVAVIDMDWHLVDVDPKYGSGWTGYTWNRQLFPDPPAFLDALHAQGKQVTLNVHPADGVRAFEDAYGAVCEALSRDPSLGEPVLFDVTDHAFMDAYFDVLHRGLERQGVDFWWLDWQSGPYSRIPGIDPLWMLNHFHFLDNARDGRRPLTFSRYAGPGSHRYPVGFSGDTIISWDSLAFQPEFTATAANLGYGWWSHDIGGHMFGHKDDELTARWLQLGVFSPILRLHSTSNAFMTKEPWSFGSETREVMTTALRLRQQLLPYLHTMNHRAAAGSPIVQPLYHRWSRAPEAYAHPQQFCFGSELLVAPITSPMDVHTRLGASSAWLPAGVWVDMFTDLVYDGDRELELHRDLRSIPVLAAAGSIVPLDAAEVPDDAPHNPQHLQLLVTVGADGHFTLIEDDDAALPRIARTPISFEQAGGMLRIGPAQGELSVLPQRRTWTVSFITSATEPGSDRHLVDVQHSATRLKVTVEDVPVAEAVDISLGEQPQLPGNDVAGRAFRLLDVAQIDYAIKSRAFEIICSPLPLHVRTSHLQALELAKPLEAALMELLLAR